MAEDNAVEIRFQHDIIAGTAYEAGLQQGELLVALVFLQSDELKTLMPAISLFKGRFNNNEPLQLTGAFLASLPMILLYLFGKRFFIEGMVAGGVK